MPYYNYAFVCKNEYCRSVQTIGAPSSDSMIFFLSSKLENDRYNIVKTSHASTMKNVIINPLFSFIFAAIGNKVKFD